MIACVPGLGDILGFALVAPLLVLLFVTVAVLCRMVWRYW